MLEVNNGWVISDNIWLWKADHCVNSSGPQLGFVGGQEVGGKIETFASAKTLKKIL